MAEAGRTNRRLARERRTVVAMIRIYCRDRHRTRGELCAECGRLHDYAMGRLDRCPFAEDKPTCAQCPVHCYQPALRERIRQVMRYAGPRMLWRHPWLAICHLLEGRKPAPSSVPRKPAKSAVPREPGATPADADRSE
jgi:hypothetical protein